MLDNKRVYTQQEIALALAAAKQWRFSARPEQREPSSDWLIWAIITGRGWGKTRTAGETITQWAQSAQCKRVHLVARTAADARDTMVEGESGLLAVGGLRGFRPNYEPSKRRLTWPNGAVAILFTADEPDALRGPQCDGWWADEIASWRYMQETWDMLQFGARLGDKVRGIITTTPRPIKLLKEILARPTTHVTRGNTLENIRNLAPSFIEQMKERYEGTRLGRQELAGEILEDNPDALWTREQIESLRVIVTPSCGFERVVVGLDPSATSTGDEAGIICVALGRDKEIYVLEDASLQGSPLAWAKSAVRCYNKNRSDRIVYESNQGGEMVAQTLKTVDNSVPLRAVHASVGKRLRAEPVAALYEQGRVHHIGAFPKLEDEMCEWTQSSPTSPNRLDALVHAIMELRPNRGEVKLHA